MSIIHSASLLLSYYLCFLCILSCFFTMRILGDDNSFPVCQRSLHHFSNECRWSNSNEKLQHGFPILRSRGTVLSQSEEEFDSKMYAKIRKGALLVSGTEQTCSEAHGPQPITMLHLIFLLGRTVASSGTSLATPGLPGVLPVYFLELVISTRFTPPICWSLHFTLMLLTPTSRIANRIPIFLTIVIRLQQ